MSPFESIYGRRCNTPMSWGNIVKINMLRPEMIKEKEQKVITIRKNLKATKDRQKIYANKSRIYVEFEIGEHVHLKFKPRRSSLKFGKCDKLAARFYGHLRSYIG